MHFRCVFNLLQVCVLVGLDWVEPMMSLTLHVTCSCIFHAYIPSFIYILILDCLVLFWLSPPLSLSFVSCSRHLNENLFRLRTLFVLGHHPILLLLIFSSVMRKPVRTSWRTFLNAAFIRNAKSSYQISLILTFPLSSTIGVRSHYVASWSLALPWSYRSFTPTCTDLIIQYSFCYSRSRYAHSDHSRYCIRGASRLEGSASWLPRLWLS